jgi:ribonuclease HI
MKLAEHNRIQMAWMSGHIEIYENEVADQLARKGFSYPLTGPQPAVGIFAKVDREMIRN